MFQEGSRNLDYNKEKKFQKKKYSLTGIGGFYPISLDIGIRVP
jgi:hypothetical protein